MVPHPPYQRDRRAYRNARDERPSEVHCHAADELLKLPTLRREKLKNMMDCSTLLYVSHHASSSRATYMDPGGSTEVK